MDCRSKDCALCNGTAVSACRTMLNHRVLLTASHLVGRLQCGARSAKVPGVTASFVVFKSPPNPASCPARPQVDQSLLNAFEACGPDAFGPNTGWGAALSSSLMHDLGRYREYRCTLGRVLGGFGDWAQPAGHKC
jgi:hypothetical protein